MTMFGSQWLANAGGGGYEIDQSIRFDSVRNSDLTRTLSGDGNLKTGTFSFWMKRSGLGSLQEIFTTYSIRSSFFFNSNDTLSMQIYNGSGYTSLTTTAVFRDPSAFAHYLFRWDTTQATDTDRLQFYYNGVLQTVTGAYPAQNSTTTFSDATYTHVISGDGSANTLYEIDAYLAEIHYVDGTALAATDFGEYNSDGVWIPIKASPTYGTNGFYITGEDSADLGADYSGNSNDFTSSGLTSADQRLDTPTLNKATLNPLSSGTNHTLSDGNLFVSTSGTSGFWHRTNATQSLTYKTYWEMEVGTYYALNFGLNSLGNSVSGQNAPAGLFGAGIQNNEAFVSGSYVNESSGGRTFPVATGNYIMFAYDPARNALWIGNEGTWKDGTASSASSATILAEIEGSGTSYAIFTGIGDEPIPYVSSYATNSATARFSSEDWEGTAPTGYEELSTAFIATPSITDGSAYFQPVLYTGTTGAQDITFSGNSDLAPDWLWFKRRDAASDHFVFDKVRGATEVLKINSSAQEATLSASMTAFDTDGFTLGDGGAGNDINGIAGSTYVAWGWSAGNSAGSSNSDGSLTSTVSVNQTSGFSIAKYVGNATSGATVGHGLGAVPQVVICKPMDATENFVMQHVSLGPTKAIYMNLTATPYTGTYQWNDTAPTSSVFSLGNHVLNNGSGNTIISYCFAQIPGYSSFGSYTGNSSTDGTFVYTGFKPSFILTKRTDSTGDWTIEDTTRSTFNLVENALFPNLTDAEDTTGDRMDILSNGFKLRTTAQPNVGTLIYMAFAENPFGGDGVAPATAR